MFRFLFLYSRSVGPRCERERVQRQISQKRHEAEPCLRGDKICHICKQGAHFLSKIVFPRYDRRAAARSSSSGPRLLRRRARLHCSTVDESPRTCPTCPRSLAGFGSHPHLASRPCGYDRPCLSLRYDHQPGRRPPWRYSGYRRRYRYRPNGLPAWRYDGYAALRNGRTSPRVTAYLLARRLAPSIE